MTEGPQDKYKQYMANVAEEQQRIDLWLDKTDKQHREGNREELNRFLRDWLFPIQFAFSAYIRTCQYEQFKPSLYGFFSAVGIPSFIVDEYLADHLDSRTAAFIRAALNKIQAVSDLMQWHDRITGRSTQPAQDQDHSTE